MVEDLEIIVGPDNREQYLREVLGQEKGLPFIQEDPNSGYCPISLTSVPEVLKPVLANRQQQIIKIMKAAGLTSYDPGTSKTSPDLSRNMHPTVVTETDNSRIAAARFFTGTKIFPSFGWGLEESAARDLNRISVILLDNSVGVSRMVVERTIFLRYEDLDAQQDELADVFRYLQQFELGIGLNHGKPALLGFRGTEVVDLAQATYQTFPDLKAEYDPNAPLPQFELLNPEIFRELRGKND